ncbi:MAG TPA: RNA polymerase sigma factor [Gemmatimonadaceae bacterium]|nr:RNA polymerase sigma factor [Gemmatimonadaceae bacterium]
MTDEELVGRAVEGDTDAYAALVERYYSSCARIARRMLRNDADAQDVVQSTFLRALRALDRFDRRRVFRVWLFTILVNQCRTAMTGRRRREQRFSDDDVSLHAAIDERPAGAIDESHLVAAAVETLEPLLREAFVLKYVEELEYAEMSAITGAGVSALKMRVKRACEALRPKLEAIYHD